MQQTAEVLVKQKWGQSFVSSANRSDITAVAHVMQDSKLSGEVLTNFNITTIFNSQAILSVMLTVM